MRETNQTSEGHDDHGTPVSEPSATKTRRVPTTDRGRALQQAVLDYYGYPPDYLEKYPERIAAITADDIASAARTHLTPDRLVTVLVAPEAPQAEGWTEIDLERAVR